MNLDERVTVFVTRVRCLVGYKEVLVETAASLEPQPVPAKPFAALRLHVNKRGTRMQIATSNQIFSPQREGHLRGVVKATRLHAL